MEIKEKEGSIWEANQIQRPPVRSWRYAEMGGKFMGDIITSGKLDVLQSHD